MTVEDVKRIGRVVVAGDGGGALAGHRGIAIAGYRGTAIAGDYGAVSIAGAGGHARVGDRGIASVGYGGIASAGEGGILVFRHLEEVDRLVVGHVGSDGIEPRTAYQLDHMGRIVRAGEDVEDFRPQN